MIERISSPETPANGMQRPIPGEPLHPDFHRMDAVAVDDEAARAHRAETPTEDELPSGVTPITKGLSGDKGSEGENSPQIGGHIEDPEDTEGSIPALSLGGSPSDSDDVYPGSRVHRRGKAEKYPKSHYSLSDGGYSVISRLLDKFFARKKLDIGDLGPVSGRIKDKL